MRKAPLFLMMLTAIAVCVGDLEAKTREDAWEVSVFVTHLDGERDTGIDNSIGGAFSFGFNFSAKVESEFLVTFNTVDFGGEDDATEEAIRTAGANPSVIGGIPERDDRLIKAIFSVTANFLADRETNTIPYVSAGLGFIQERRDAFPLLVRVDNPNADPNDPNIPAVLTVETEGRESFDTSAVLTLAVGARTFFTDNFGIRYEARYFHHDSFEFGQDEYQLAAGATWMFGGQK